MAISPTSISFCIFWAITGFFKWLWIREKTGTFESGSLTTSMETLDAKGRLTRWGPGGPSAFAPGSSALQGHSWSAAPQGQPWPSSSRPPGCRSSWHDWPCSAERLPSLPVWAETKINPWAQLYSNTRSRLLFCLLFIKVYLWTQNHNTKVRNHIFVPSIDLIYL